MQIVNTEEWTSKIKEKFDGKKYFIYTLGFLIHVVLEKMLRIDYMENLEK